MSLRIASSTFHELGYQSIAKNQSELLKIQNQFATGKRINSAADDPAGTMRASELKAAKSVNDQYQRNQTYAQNSLNLLDGTLSDISDVMQSMRETLLAAGNATLNATDRQQYAQQLRSKLDQMLNLSNSRDEAGRYLFAGFNDAAAPFTFGGSTLTYSGDNGVRELQVSSSVDVPLNVSGQELFVDVLSGNGVIQTSGAAANTGAGLINGGSVTNASALTNENFQVQIRNVSGALVYDVVNTTTATTLVTGAAFTAGAAINVGPALAVSITGTPAHGDVFNIGPAQQQNIFQSIQTAITALERNAAGSISNTALSDALRIGISNLDQSFDRVLNVRNQFGNIGQELDLQADSTSRTDIDLQTRISDIVDLDPIKASTDLAQTQTNLEASQALYSRITRRTLFDYI